MGHSVFFDLRIRDFTKDTLFGVGATGKSVFSGIDREVNNLHKDILSLSGPVKLNIDASGLHRVGADIDRLEGKMGGFGRGSFGSLVGGSFLGNMGANLLTSALQTGMSEVKSVVSGGLEAGMMQEQFKVLAGKQQGEQLYSGLKKYIADSVFGPELYGNARTMLAFGIAAKDVLPNLKMLGDISMGSKEKMDQLTLAFSQTMSAGKLMGNELLQYSTAGFNPLQIMSEKTGRSMAALRKDMERSGISAKRVEDAFRSATGAGGKWYNMLDTVGKTPYGKYQAMMGSWEDVKTGLGVAIAPAIGTLLDRLKPGLEALPEKFERMAPKIEQAIIGFGELIPVMGELGGVALKVIKPFGELVISPEFKELAKSLGGLATEIGTKLEEPMRLFALSLNGGTKALKDLIDLLPQKPGTVDMTPGNPYKSGAEPGFIWESDLPSHQKRLKDAAAGVPVVEKSIYRPGSEKDLHWQAEQRKKNIWAGVWDPGGRSMGKPQLFMQPTDLGASKAALGAPAVPEPTKQPGMSKEHAAVLEGVSNSITGGGQRVVHINFRNMIENWHSQARTEGESRLDVETRLKEVLARILAGVPS